MGGIVPEWTLGDRLRKARETAGLTAAQLAQQLGVHRNTIGNWESDRISPGRASVLAWAALTGVSADWLVGGDVNGYEPHRRKL